jgi:hypothetical protein
MHRLACAADAPAPSYETVGRICPPKQRAEVKRRADPAEIHDGDQGDGTR